MRRRAFAAMVLARSGGEVVDQIGGQFFGDGGASGFAGAGGEQSGERADGGLFGGYFWGWGGTWIVAHGVRGFHDFDPYGQGHAAAVGLTSNAFWLIQSDPDAAGDRAVVAEEIGVGEIIDCAGFARDRHVFEAVVGERGGTRAATQGILQSGIDLIGGLRTERFDLSGLAA